MIKTGIFALSALSLINSAVAQPAHRRHQQLHDKRDVVTVVNYVTAPEPDVIVYVNEEGEALSTVTNGQTPTAASTPSPTAAHVAAAITDAATSWSTTSSTSTTSSSTTSSSSTTTPSPAATSWSAAASWSAGVSFSASASASASASGSSSGSSSSGPSGYGLAYSPYNDDGSCMTQDQVNSDFESISGYDFIRTYGTDCNQVATVLSAAKAKGMKLFAGIFDITSVESEIATIISAADGDFSHIDTVSIGNEGVNDGTYTVSAVVSAISTARSLLKAAGFTGNVVTVDTFVAIIANPELCEASDFAAANAHPFFDGSIAAEVAGPWVLEQMDLVSKACGGKNTWITETGWPTQGDTNSAAVPSTSNQKAAIDSIKSSLASNVILFSAFNDMWKTNTAYTYGAEQYWGILN